MTRFAFIGSSLEPGADGVGDYMRCLAGELVGRGHQVALIGLHDRHMTSSSIHVRQTGKVREIRLSAGAPWEERVAQSRAFLKAFQPDWVSLQFVCYGFQHKGLLLRERKFLLQLLAGYRVHLMMHEIWLLPDMWRRLGRYQAMRKGVGGRAQRYLNTSFIARLGPQLIHTSNSFYQQQLAMAGVPADVLPLFGNIPIDGRNADHWLYDMLCEQGIEISPETRSASRLFLVFGDVNPAWPVDALLARLARSACAANHRAVVLHAGRSTATPALSKLSHAINPVVFASLGTQTGQRISQLFASVDAGLTPHPYQCLGKSGTVTAMLEHGLPVVASWGDQCAGRPPVPPRLAPLVLGTSELDTVFHGTTVRGSVKSMLPIVADQFLEALLGPAQRAAA